MRAPDAPAGRDHSGAGADYPNDRVPAMRDGSGNGEADDVNGDTRPELTPCCSLPVGWHADDCPERPAGPDLSRVPTLAACDCLDGRKLEPGAVCPYCAGVVPERAPRSIPGPCVCVARGHAPFPDVEAGSACPRCGAVVVEAAAPPPEPAAAADPCPCSPCVSRRRRRANRAPYENADYAEALRRQIRSYARRVGAGDPEDLTTMLGLLAEFEAAVAEAVTGLHEGQGWSWAAIGRAAGIHRQSAYDRWSGAGE